MSWRPFLFTSLPIPQSDGLRGIALVSTKSGAKKTLQLIPAGESASLSDQLERHVRRGKQALREHQAGIANLGGGAVANRLLESSFQISPRAGQFGQKFFRVDFTRDVS